jgi:hypothetical protein
MIKYIAMSLVVAASGALFFSLYLFPVNVCACASAWSSLAYEAGISGFSGPGDISAAQLEAGLNRKLVGTTAEYSFSKLHCSKPSTGTVVCLIPWQRSFFVTYNMQVIYRFDSNDLLSSARVTRLSSHEP